MSTFVASFAKNDRDTNYTEARPQFVHLGWNDCLAFNCFEDRLVLTLKTPEYMSMVLLKDSMLYFPEISGYFENWRCREVVD